MNGIGKDKNLSDNKLQVAIQVQKAST